MSNNKQQPKPENPNNQFSNTEPLTHAQRVAIANKMSNNKQSMKLYTKEQVIQMILSSYLHGVERAHDYKDVKEHILKTETPIELPSDEEIDEAIFPHMELNIKVGFIEGAKWMRDKIQGGNK